MAVRIERENKMLYLFIRNVYEPFHTKDIRMTRIVGKYIREGILAGGLIFPLFL